ncbi:efflux RND transporter periplasmic adaptor subunit [Aliiglaciecola sp. M165]|nr:efflux RND transporter periplasmic adaptor subunit [Aliiglaciecola sp. M165]
MSSISKLQQSNQPSRTTANSGASMDRKIAPKRSFKKIAGLIALGILTLAFIYFVFNKSSGGRGLTITSHQITISTVEQGIFEDFIPLRGRVTPAKTVYLDAIEGGRVERVVAEDGAQLKAGDLIVEMSNASLQLSVLGNEARVAEQLNNIRSIELSLEQNRLQHKRNLADIRYQIKVLSRQLQREQELVKTGAIVLSTMEDTRDELHWYEERLQLTLESQASDARMQQSQLAFLQETGQRLMSNLEISRQNLDSLKVRAPVDGKLSGFDVEVGQSIGRGERVGQIDTPDDFKVTAFLDEFYLGRVDIGQTAIYENYPLQVTKVYPQVQNGQFEVDLEFIANQPPDIRRGQTIQTKLTLGDESKALIIPNGAFYQDTGGSWIFVVADDESVATRRNVRLGRRNSRFIEVIEGLEVGEKVITSPYTSFTDIQRLTLQ